MRISLKASNLLMLSPWPVFNYMPYPDPTLMRELETAELIVYHKAVTVKGTGYWSLTFKGMARRNQLRVKAKLSIAQGDK